MLPDDPRHATPAGAKAHWADGEKPCEPCRLASLRARKRNRYLELIGRPATLPATGTVRRIHALMAIGWTQPRIAEAAGVTVKTLRNPLFRGDSVYRSTHEAVAEAYERLCMKLPPERTTEEKRGATYARNLARKRGWAPPLAWDDIDTDPEPRASRYQESRRRDDYDEVVVLRILAGDKVRANRLEYAEALRRWKAEGGTEAEFCKRLGLKEGRYGRDRAA